MKKTTCFRGHFYLEVGAKFGSRDKGSCGKRFDFCDAAITTMLIIWTGSADVLTAVGTRQDCGASVFAKNYKMLWFLKNNLINYYLNPSLGKFKYNNFRSLKYPVCKLLKFSIKCWFNSLVDQFCQISCRWSRSRSCPFGAGGAGSATLLLGCPLSEDDYETHSFCFCTFGCQSKIR